MATPDEFVAAQEGCWPEVVAELTAGRKTSHWIWWVFPQLETLGRSPRARHFGLAGVEEARAYLAHPVLGPRLVEAAELLMRHAGTAPEDILGAVDALKVRSSMTLFEAVPGADPVFARVLDTFYAGDRCPHTTDQIG
ncbi:hypothetical protein ATO8_07931 [Roseivivax marinus]|uniref:Calpastatin n=1 Tax=Roseivivax marinus TaxID=1379903 RepID=W4HK72_9RHOB|nr:DUF1810 domain-containing protein [Roseivivax marinus]ETW13124.1 hypothetical protein ATO8_07931 [Roseivivax marinus]UMA63372.1 DUF1810 domain-containing protein [Roseivivax marinus]